MGSWVINGGITPVRGKRVGHFTLLLGLILAVGTVAARAQTETILHSFGGIPTDGAGLWSSLISDAAGNLYGTTEGGGPDEIGCYRGCGTVFELVKSPSGYTEELLHVFTYNEGRGALHPLGGLIMDSAGNLFGTTTIGGDHYYGTVFELVKSDTGYKERVLYSFGGSTDDGMQPESTLVMDSAGNLYGTTPMGGHDNAGTVFELVKSAGGYAEDVLYSFTSSSDGGDPAGGLVMDSAGDLYGTTQNGGTYDQGVVFELVKSGSVYTETVLYTFTGHADGGYPQAGLMMDSAGNLYGTTSGGGATVFELVKSPAGYTEKVLFNTYNAGLVAGVIMDSAGNLYATSTGGALQDGGPKNLNGAVFKLTNSSAGYTLRLLWSFQGTPGDGFQPKAGLIMDSAGNLYGTTYVGGANNGGTVFEVDPNATGTGVTLSPSTLSLGTAVVVGTEAWPQAARLTNNTASTLNLSSVWISGADASDFLVGLSAVGTNCSTSTSLPPGGTCATLAVFAPSAAGNESAILNIADSAGTQTVNLTGTGVIPDFTLSPSAGTPTSATVNAGGGASFEVTLAPEWGFNQEVSLTCSGAPALARCNVVPASYTLDGLNPAGLTVGVTTTAPALTVPRVPNSPIVPPAAAWTAIVTLIGLLLAGAAWRKGTVRRAWLMPLLAIALTVVLTNSCGGGGGVGGSSSSSSSPGTPAGTYTLTVTGTSGSFQRSTTLTLTVR